VTHVFVVEEAERKTSKNDKPYVRVKVTGMGWASIWEGDSGNLVLSTPMPATFKGELKEDGDFKNLSGLSLADGETPTPQASSKSEMTKGDWDAKESREAFRIAWAVVYKVERDNQTFPDAAMERALKFAELVEGAAWRHGNPEKFPF
jgi:hypothetical protein